MRPLPMSMQLGADLVSEEALVERICAHAQGVLEREVCCKGCEPLPERLCALILHYLLATVNYSCGKPRVLLRFRKPSDRSETYVIL